MKDTQVQQASQGGALIPPHKRRKAWLRILAIVAGLIVVLVATLVIATPYLLRSMVDEQGSARLGRAFTVEGPLKIHWHWHTPRLEASRIKLANIPESPEPQMVEIEKLDVSIKIWKLLAGKIDLPVLTLEQPVIILDRVDEDTRNWDFGTVSQANIVTETALPDNRREFPLIGSLSIREGKLVYRDATKGLDVELALNTADGESGDDEQRFQLTGEGTLQDEAFTLKATGGALDMLHDTDKDFPLMIDLAMGATKIHVNGVFSDPVAMKGIDTVLTLEGDNLANIFYLTGIPLPPTPPYTLSGHLTREEDVWHFRDFKGTVGDSNLDGSLSYDTGRERSFLQAELVSRLLDMDDLGGFIGVTPSTAQGETASPAQAEQAAREQASDKFLPDVPLDLSRLRAIDMDVTLKAEKIEAPGWPFQDMEARFDLKDGLLVIKPLRFTFADGLVDSTLTLNGRTDIPGVALTADLKRLSLKSFFEDTAFADLSSGTFGGHIELAGQGQSLAQVLASSDGRVIVIMSGGQISLLLVEALDLDIGQALPLILGDDQITHIRCGVGDFIVKDGLFASDIFVFDTDDSNLQGDIRVNFNDEALNAKLTAYAKDPSIIAGQSPIVIGGTLKNPAIGLEPVETGLRVAAAVALGTVLTPLAAAIPFIELGLGEDSDCRALIQYAREQAPKPVDDAPR